MRSVGCGIVLGTVASLHPMIDMAPGSCLSILSLVIAGGIGGYLCSWDCTDRYLDHDLAIGAIATEIALGSLGGVALYRRVHK
ncbi:MAG: hypothetical protein LBJ92_04145 [Holosporales bacterium]|nr:hypothetical protein [Holosporales bacterium]